MNAALEVDEYLTGLARINRYILRSKVEANTLQHVENDIHIQNVPEQDGVRRKIGAPGYD